MAAIDSLLGVLRIKKADGLSLVGGDVPALLVGGTRSPLTMPPLAAAMLDVFIDELLTPAERDALAAGGEVETSYRAPELGDFVVRAKRVGQATKLVLKRGTAAGRAAARLPAGDPPVVPEPAVPAASAPARAPDGTSRVEPRGQHGHDGRIAAAFTQATARGATDLLLSAGAPPILRIDGDLVDLRGDALAHDDLAAFFAPLLSPERRRVLDTTGSVDLAYAVDDAGVGRFRVNLFRQHRGLAAAVRPIRDEVPTLDALGLPASLLPIVSTRNGLVLMTGATGAGKSTTLAALVDHVNRTRACHVVTLEDPIEHVYPRRRALIHQREVGTDVASFAVGLRAALREAPDVILVGELRDTETIRMALTAAETGHLVLSTLHSGNPIMAIERLIDAFADSEKADVRQQIATTVRHVVTQQLVRTKDGGRIPVLEVLAVNAAVAAQIRDGRTHMLATQMELGADAGMVSMERSLAELVRAGRISREVALEAAPRRDAIDALLLTRR